MTDVVGHPWTQGPTASAAEVREEFNQRRLINLERAREANLLAEQQQAQMNSVAQ